MNGEQLGLKASSVDLLIKFTTEIEVMTEIVSLTSLYQELLEVAIGGITWLLKPILQPSNDIVNGFKKIG